MDLRSFLVCILIVAGAWTFAAFPGSASPVVGSLFPLEARILLHPGTPGCPAASAGDCFQKGPLIAVLATKSPFFQSFADTTTGNLNNTLQLKPMSAPGFKESTTPVTPLTIRKPVTGTPTVTATVPATINPLTASVIAKLQVATTGTPLLKTNMFSSGQSSLPKIAFPSLNTSVSQQNETPAPVYVSDTTKTIEQRIFYYTNVERTKAGKSAYVYDSKLSDIARADAVDMATRNFFDHVNPDGETPTDRAKRQGYNVEKDYGTYYRIGVGENIAMVQHIQGTPDEIAQFIVNAWMNSPDHRENILDLNGADYTNLGVGVAYDAANDKYLAVQEFF